MPASPCLAIEVNDESDLPQINRDLAEMSQALNKEFGRYATVNDWRQCITARRQQAPSLAVPPPH